MMKTLLILLLFTGLIRGQSSKDLLRDGLFAEESEGDLSTAAAKYEKLLTQFEAERKVAAVALYRLAEVRRKQNQPKAAAKLYRQLIQQFSGIEPQEKLSRENLLALGEKLPESGGGIILDEEQQELTRLKKLAITSPDRVKDPAHAIKAAENNWSAVITWLHQNYGKEPLKGALRKAASTGNLAICRQLLDAGVDPNSWEDGGALMLTIEQGFEKVFQLLKSKGAKTTPGAIPYLVKKGHKPERLQWALDAGANINFIQERPENSKTTQQPGYNWSSASALTIIEAAGHRDVSIVKFLLKNKADPNLRAYQDSPTALHFAAQSNRAEVIKLLIDAGADIDATTNFHPRTYGESSAPIVFAAPHTKAFRLLLEAGAKIPSGTLMRVASTGDIALVDSLLAKGVDINEFQNGEAPSQTALSQALWSDHFELAAHLRKKGAKVFPEHWKHLTGELSIQWHREMTYPNLAQSGQVHLIFPEQPGDDALLASLTADASLSQNILALRFPCEVGVGSERRWVDLNKFTWTLVRKGKSTPLDFAKDGFPDLLPNDIIEVIGYQRGGAGLSIYKSRSLKDHWRADVTAALCSRVSLPFIFEMDGKQYHLTMRRDRATYDPRSGELPYMGRFLSVMSLLGMNFEGPRIGKWHLVEIHRKGRDPVSFHLASEASKRFQLHKNDRVVVTEFPVGSLDAQNAKSLKKHYHDKQIRVEVAGKPAGWAWTTGATINIPSLQQVLAEIHQGYSIDRYNNRRSLKSDAVSMRDQPESLVRFAIGLSMPLTIAPAIDLSAIRIRRLTGDGYEELTIDLLKQITDWTAAGKKDAPSMIELRPGDLISLTLQDGEWSGPSEEFQAYLEAALTIPILKMNDQGVYIQGNLNYKPAAWISHQGNLIPLTHSRTSSSAKNLGISKLEKETQIRRGLETFQVDPYKSYWPRSMDQFGRTPTNGSGKRQGGRSLDVPRPRRHSNRNANPPQVIPPIIK